MPQLTNVTYVHIQRYFVDKLATP